MPAIRCDRHGLVDHAGRALGELPREGVVVHLDSCPRCSAEAAREGTAPGYEPAGAPVVGVRAYVRPDGALAVTPAMRPRARKPYPWLA